MNRDERALKRTIGRVARLPEAKRERLVASLPVTLRRTFEEFWAGWAHEGQLPPRPCSGQAPNAPAFAGAQAGAATSTGSGQAPWLILAGRGFGKTRAGAEWVSRLARSAPGLRIALVGATIEDARKVMVEGRSGLLAVARTGEAVRYARTEGVVRFASGAEAFLYSGACPEKLRGPEHHFAWCDEIAKWRHAEAAWDNLSLGLRLGDYPQALVTTTPRATPLLRRLVAEAEAAGTLARGRMADNLNLPEGFVAAMAAAYGGTRKGREELDGELIQEAEGALWTRALIEACRVFPFPGEGRGPVEGEGWAPACAGERSGRSAAGEKLPVPYLKRHKAPPPPRVDGPFRRIVIGVDPPASAEGDACGIVACALGADGVGYVLGDHSARGLSPEGWASAVAAAARAWGADCVIVERNQGGDMVKSVLKAADRELPVRTVFARYGKGDRAEPVAILFETGRARFAGAFPALEDELCAMVRGGGYKGPGRSPDRADAMVWGLTALMLGRGEPGVRGF